VGAGESDAGGESGVEAGESFLRRRFLLTMNKDVISSLRVAGAWYDNVGATEVGDRNESAEEASDAMERAATTMRRDGFRTECDAMVCSEVD